MKLFENGVGRPSNEIKRKREIFVITVAMLIISVVLLTTYLIVKPNKLSDDLKGASVTTKKTTTILNKKITFKFIKTNNSNIAVTGSMSNYLCDTNSKCNLPAVNFKADGANFKGWKAYRLIDGKKKYFVKGRGWVGTSSNALVIKNRTELNKNYKLSSYTQGGTTIYLEAIWEETGEKTKIIFKYQKPSGSYITGSMPDSLCERKNSKTCELSNVAFKGKGLVFKGWKAYRLIDGKKKYFVKDSSGWVGNNLSSATTLGNSSKIGSTYNIFNYVGREKEYVIYLDSVWESAKGYDKGYTIVFESKGGKGTMENQSLKKSNAKGSLLKKNKFKKDGYNFYGWKAYRVIFSDGKIQKKYFLANKGWSESNSTSATLIKNAEAIQANNGLNIDKYTYVGNYIFLEAQWGKKYSLYIYNYDNKVKDMSNVNSVTGTFPVCTYDKCKGWKAYRIVGGKELYWNDTKKNWSGTYENTKVFISIDKINIFEQSTGNNSKIYLTPVRR